MTIIAAKTLVLADIAAQEERNAIVTWLRDGDDEASERLCDALREEIWRQRNQTDKSPNGVFAAQPYFDLFAEAIRRGDHFKEPSA